MSSSILSDNNGSGSLKWNFNAPDKDFDFLAKNETLVLTYEHEGLGQSRRIDEQTVTMTITGTDDKPVIDDRARARSSTSRPIIRCR